MSTPVRGARRLALLAAHVLVAWHCLALGAAHAQLPSFAEHHGVTIEGWTLERVEEQPTYVRLHFRQGGRDAHVEINLREQLDTGVGTERFSLQAAPEGFAPEALQQHVLTWLRAIEAAGESRGVAPPHVPVARVIRVLQGVLALALSLFLAGVVAAWRSRQSSSRHVAGHSWRRHALPIAVFTVSGALLRVAQGSRIPGFVGGHGTGHGFEDVAAALGERLPRLDPRGNGAAALADLWFAAWPRTEWALLTLQATLSVLTIPLVYLAALAWLREQREATWATAVYALYPSAAYFAMTEVRTVPGAFFLMLGLVVLGLGLERRRSLWVASGGLFAVLATTFHPVLLPAPFVLALFAASRRDAWPFMRSPRALLALAAVAAAWSILLRLTWLQLSLAPAGAVLGGDAASIVASSWRVVLPTLGLPLTPSSAFLNLQITPALFVVSWGLGVAALRRPQRRRVLLTLVLAAFGMTIPGLAGARYDLAHLQYAAAPLHTMIAGVGCVALVEHVVGRLRAQRVRRMVPAALAIALGLSVAVSPGPLSGAFVYAGERQVAARALPVLRESGPCDVWVAPTSVVAYSELPSYVTREVLPSARWRSLGRADDVAAAVGGSLTQDGCAYYFRPSACWAEPAAEAQPRDPAGIRAECAAVESQLRLSPLHVETIAARPEAEVSYGRPHIEVGFFRIDSLAL